VEGEQSVAQTYLMLHTFSWLCFPIFEAQTFNSAKLSGIMRYKDQAVLNGDRRDHEVVWADRCSLLRQVSANTA
jgi:hypothetical protein